MFVFNLIRDKSRVLANLLAVALERYYKWTKKIPLEINNLISRVFDCLRATFIVYGPIG